jgi:hypothetical protein
MEIWKKITNFEIYEVSNLGRVKGPKGIKARGSHKYHSVDLFIDGKRYPKYVHRLVAEMFIPNPNNKLEVNHINGIKDDNRVDNLQWVSRAENMKHAYDNGLVNVPILFGKDNPSYKNGRGCGNYRGQRKNRLV